MLSGLIAAPFTPFLPNSDLNTAVIPRLAQLLGHNGVAGAFICGTTGEGISMTSDERRLTAEAWRAAITSGPPLKLIVHVGHLSLGESCALARHAEDIGVDAIASIAPCFFKPPGVDELVTWCQRVAAAAPATPFYYYHMPAMTGVEISAESFLSCAQDRIPTLAGVKFTNENLRDYQAARVIAGERMDVLFGRDEILLSGLELGAKGAVGSTYNFAAPLYERMIQAWRTNNRDSAGRDQAGAQAFIKIMHRFGGLPAGKAIMKFIGIDCGPVRLPLRNLSAVQEADFHAELVKIGFFNYASQI